jgi:hypothetical protein
VGVPLRHVSPKDCMVSRVITLMVAPKSINVLLISVFFDFHINDWTTRVKVFSHENSPHH